MATIQTNRLTKDFRGSIGNLTFRQVAGRTIVSGKPHIRTKQSELQKENRLKFKAAAAWAKAQLLQPERKAYYTKMAKKLKLPNAYTAAVSDCMRKGEIKEVNTYITQGKQGSIVRIKVFKKDFAINNIKVSLVAPDGTVLYADNAKKKSDNFFIVHLSGSIERYQFSTIQVTLGDHPNNMASKQVLFLTP